MKLSYRKASAGNKIFIPSIYIFVLTAYLEIPLEFEHSNFELFTSQGDSVTR